MGFFETLKDKEFLDFLSIIFKGYNPNLMLKGLEGFSYRVFKAVFYIVKDYEKECLVFEIDRNRLLFYIEYVAAKARLAATTK